LEERKYNRKLSAEHLIKNGVNGDN
jgi:hypothetical protein